MTKKDKILNAMLSHTLIKEKYNIDNHSEDSSGVDNESVTKMLDTITIMIKAVEIQKKSNEEVASLLLKTLND